MYQAVLIEKGQNGWGGPLLIEPNNKKNKIVSITGGGIDAVTKKIAKLTGAVAVDGFNTSVKEEEMACVVINCGGTLRCGLYPKKEIPTVNLESVGKSGPFAEYINEEIYVSGVKEESIHHVESMIILDQNFKKEVEVKEEEKIQEKVFKEEKSENHKKNQIKIFEKSRVFSRFVSNCEQGGKEAVETVLKEIIPCMAFFALISGIIMYTGLGDRLSEFVYPYLGTIIGLLLLSLICVLPIVSPLLGSGALIAQLFSVIIGLGIALGAFPIYLALPALFAVDAQVGCNYIPAGLAMGEAEQETIDVAVPAILISRMITGPLSVAIALYFAMVMYGYL